MPTNPNLIPGNINRIRGTILIPANPTLNVTASYLTSEGISITPQSAVATVLAGMASTVISEEPYQMVQVRASLLRTLALAEAYLEQIKQSPVVGQITVTPDTNVISPFILYNASIVNWQELSFAGRSADFAVVFAGYFNISNDLWSL